MKTLKVFGLSAILGSLTACAVPSTSVYYREPGVPVYPVYAEQPFLNEQIVIDGRPYYRHYHNGVPYYHHSPHHR